MGGLFGTDGIRGRAGRGALAPRAVARIAQAVGQLLRKDPAILSSKAPRGFEKLRADGPGRGRVLIGRDTRASGPSIERALAAGFAAAGVGVVRAGVLSTPGVAALTRAWGCALGAVISASHNPAHDNGIKFFSPQGLKMPDGAEEAIELLLVDGELPTRRGAPAPLTRKPLDDYLDILAPFGPSLKGLTLAVDCAHGASSATARPLLERLGARVIVVNASPDGRNINAGCGALHPEKIARVVRREKADLGVAFDGDADRAIFVDETGEVRDGDHVLAVCGTHLDERRRLPRRTVVSTVMANFGLGRALAARGIRLLRARVGDRYVAEEMLRAGAVLGGEQSGHMLFFDASPAGDGLLTTLRVLGVMAERGEPLSRLSRILVKYPQTLLNVPVTRKPPLEEAGGVPKAVASAEKVLGADGRILVRYSGTEPLCRVMVEGPRAGMVRRLARAVADAVRRELA